MNHELRPRFESFSVAGDGVGGVGAPLAAVPALGRLDEAIVAESLSSCMERGINICLCESKNP